MTYLIVKLKIIENLNISILIVLTQNIPRGEKLFGSSDIFLCN